MNPHLQRRLATGANAVFVAALVVALAGTLVDLAVRHPLRWDLTEDASATLLPETRALLDRIGERQATFEITAFSSQQKNEEAWLRDRMVRDHLRALELASPHVSTRFVDFDGDRRTAEELGVDRYGTIVVAGLENRVDVSDRELFRASGKGEQRRLEFLGEDAIGKAFEQILSNRQRRIYALTGHGERAPYDRGAGELRTLASLVDAQGWQLASLDLLRSAAPGAPPAVPDDAAAVLLLAPTAPLGASEEEALRSFLARGGSLGLFVDPGRPTPILLDDLGVRVPAGGVHDAVNVYPYDDRPLLTYGRHPITQELTAGSLATVVSSAAPVLHEPRDGVTVTGLLGTSRAGWIERGTERPAVFDPAVDGAGPVDVAVAVQIARTGGSATGRVLVVGDGDAVTDAILADGPGNATFVVNGLRWLLGGDERMSVVARPGHIRRIALSGAQLSVVRALLVFALPLLPLLCALAVRWTRRTR